MESGTPEDTLVFELKIRCRKNPNPPKDASSPDDLYIDNNGTERRAGGDLRIQAWCTMSSAGSRILLLCPRTSRTILLGT